MAAPNAATVLVTGASSGIGLATAKLLSQRGFRVVAGLRNASHPAARQALENRGIEIVQLDATCAADITALAAQLEIALEDRGLAGLINNAGIALAGPLEQTPIGALNRLFEVNLVGTVAVTQAMLPLLRRARGRILNVGSVTGMVARPFLGAYGASKAALENLTDAWRLELRPSGVETTLVAVGRVDTPIWEKAAQQIRAWQGAATAEQLVRFQALYDGMAQWCQASQGLPPERVAETIARALVARRVRRRYVVSQHALSDTLLPWLPGSVRDWWVTHRLPPHG